MATGLGRSGFDLDLKHGKLREEALGAILRGDQKVEIKSDGKCRETGNLFIEYRQKGRPSGIAVTEADYWAFEFADDNWLIVPTGKLKAIARQAYMDPRNRKRGGDYNEYEGVLVRIESLVKHWHRVK